MRSDTKITRIGEEHVTNEGHPVLITEYINAKNVSIIFLDNTIIKNLSYNTIIKGQIRKPVNRVGERWETSEGDTPKIIEYFSWDNCTIQFIDGFILKNVRYSDLKKGQVSNPYYRSVCGVGYHGEGEHKSYLNGKRTKSYRSWSTMLNRCYSSEFKKDNPSYIGCLVDERWHNFQTFAKWFDDNYTTGFELDKDILVDGNKIYSPETCVFVPKKVNGVFRTDKINVNLPKGVSKKYNKYYVNISIKSKKLPSKSYDTPEEASDTYIYLKEKWAKDIAEECKDIIDSRVYIKLLNYKVQ